MKKQVFRITAIGIFVLSLFSACRKNQEAGLSAVPAAERVYDISQNRIPISNRSAVYAEFRQMLRQQGITDETQISNYIIQQEQELKKLEVISAERIRNAQNGGAGARNNENCSPEALADFCIQPMVANGQSGYNPRADHIASTGTAQPYIIWDPGFPSSCGRKLAEYRLPDNGCPSSVVGVGIGVVARKQDQQTMRIAFDTHVTNHGPVLTDAHIYIYVLGNDNNWYLSIYVPGMLSGPGNLLPVNAVETTQDNFRYYSIQVWTRQLSTWCGTAGDGLWKVSHTAYTITDTDCPYNP